MTTFDDRERAFEARFVHEADQRFRAEALCTRLAAEWAAGLMGMSGAAADRYLSSLRRRSLAAGSDAMSVLRTTLLRDLGTRLTEGELAAQIDELHARAVRQIASPPPPAAPGAALQDGLASNPIHLPAGR